jgi:NAD(P)-dependent dehydrogenase (short-subunit alcohol dehydrogenase family)
MTVSPHFQGKVALVTGAASSAGAATALAFAGEGAAVVVADSQGDQGRTVAERIRATGANAVFVRCDLSDGDDIRNMIEETIRHFGRLDCAFNNAAMPARGTMPGHEVWDDVVNTDLRRVWLCMKFEIPHLLQQGGTIVNCSSVRGAVGIDGADDAGTVAQQGLVGMTRTAARAFAPQNIRVTAICPGAVATPDAFMSSPLGHAQAVGQSGGAEEIANAVLWLCRADAGPTVGQVLTLDGSQTVQ